MKKGFGKGFCSGILVAAWTVGLGESAMAASHTITVDDNIRITLNCAVFSPKDAKGRDVPLFSYNGTTYAPVRAICEAAGLKVDFDSANYTAVLTTPDRYIASTPSASTYISVDKAKEIALKALAPLGEDYLNLLREGFANGWIDVYENEGKRSGAYSAGARVHPYVLLNFKGTLDDVFTLVHEMGHSIHSYLSNKTQPTAYQDYVIFVAEVASTCNEALLMEYLLSVTTDKKERAYLINHFLEQFRGTLYRQTMFAEAE